MIDQRGGAAQEAVGKQVVWGLHAALLPVALDVRLARRGGCAHHCAGDVADDLRYTAAAVLLNYCTKASSEYINRKTSSGRVPKLLHKSQREQINK